ncbi:MAG: ClpXP protease specificity-enhancing factor [Aliivibrio sp.]|uniref:ClpXP protease specificity-enhancing factor n=1 Tax=Aliivibrio sp. TaxID=1872443 RepID=UPI001A44FE72|nr:ClpXP protease specificity-enhancing factor [Aliivibrio sp.]
MSSLEMTPRRPYLVRAFYEWIVDNELTPHLVADAMLDGVRVPMEFVKDGQIILNLAPHAVGNLEIGNEAITFSARFSGQPHSIIVPMYAVEAIYARENGAGTMFEPESAYSTEQINEQVVEDESDKEPLLSSVNKSIVSELEKPLKPSRPTGKPSLRVIK